MKIPKSFKLMGRTITVEYDEKRIFNEGANATSYMKEDKIVMQSDCNGIPVRKLHAEQTFLHELTHWILYMMDEDFKNEKYIEVFSGLLHQALITMEYDNDRPK